MPPPSRHRADEERRRLFRRMEWLYVFGPPLVAVFVAVSGALIVAWLVPVPGTSFWGRWAIVVAIVLGIPLAWQLFLRLRE